ncbi:MAG: GNAT family N-acetyltransferase [Oscillatoriaceae cyanobacterium Prado104]|jgi:predicted N-acetyltransferase YhbS|nr:GNAT family N-acetyltransferase [Oscillatoriaceae cyanobacterium Prado104]
MNVALRRATAADIAACSRINYEAFQDISDRHQFPTDFPTLEFSTEIIGFLIESPLFFELVAESEGAVVGCGFMDERNPIRGIGPVSVDRTFQGCGAGRAMMQALLERGKEANGIRLVQESFNMASLSLYTSLGFEVKEPFVLLEGKFRGQPESGFEVRPMASEDVGECAALCEKLYGCDRTADIEWALNADSPFVACKDGRIAAYTCAISALSHSLAETEADMQALLLGATALGCEEVVSFHLPLRYASLFRWCLHQGLRAIKPMSVMSVGEYRQPQGCYFPSFVY